MEYPVKASDLESIKNKYFGIERSEEQESCGDSTEIIDDNDDNYEGNCYDSIEVTFYRPEGETETKDVKWCKDNAFIEVEKGLWSGECYYETDLQTRKSLRMRSNKAYQSLNDGKVKPREESESGSS